MDIDDIEMTYIPRMSWNVLDALISGATRHAAILRKGHARPRMTTNIVWTVGKAFKSMFAHSLLCNSFSHHFPYFPFASCRYVWLARNMLHLLTIILQKKTLEISRINQVASWDIPSRNMKLPFNSWYNNSCDLCCQPFPIDLFSHVADQFQFWRPQPFKWDHGRTKTMHIVTKAIKAFQNPLHKNLPDYVVGKCRHF